MLIYGSTGLGIAPVDVETVSVPSGNGSLLRHTRLAERDIYLPVALFGETVEECDQLRDELMALVDPLAGPVRITVQSQTREQHARWIDAVYTEGLSGDYSKDFNGVTHKLGLKFRAPDALWRLDTVTRQWQIAPGVKPFLSKTTPFFPIILTSSSIAGRFRIDVQGQEPVWPVWTVTGPGEDLTITSGGKRIRIDGALKAGEVITIDTANGDVYNGENLNGELWSRVSLDTELFQLQPGAQDVQVTLTGASEASMLTLAYEPLYLAGY
ncbi:phage tail domain-containing protein [Rothia kristinae]|uniref:phage distal tail protein n=2 Tax=Actinomycetota TaxID=201174 RepID=UPI00342D12EA